MTGYPLLDVFWTMFEFFLWVLWFFLLFKIITDIFRSDMNGWGKAGWLVFVILLPLIGVLVYLIARGGSMARRDAEAKAQADAAFKDYVRQAAGSGMDEADQAAAPSTADQLAKLAKLKEDGHLTEQEYQTAKAGVLK